MPSDWRTVGLLVAMFVAIIVLVVPLGWAITERAVLRRLRNGSGQQALCAQHR